MPFKLNILCTVFIFHIPVLTGASSTSARRYSIEKAFSLFCREFENVVNRAFLVLIFLGGEMVGANFYAFCNYAQYH